MKRGFKIKLFALGLAAVLTAPFLAGCNKEKPRKRVELVEGSLPLGVYAERMDITVGQMVSATKYISGETASDNVVYDLYREILNVNFVSKFSANIGEAYTTQLSMAMLGDDLPDLFFARQSELSELIEQDMVADLTEAYEKYASPALRLAVEYGYTGDYAMWNGGNPSIPRRPEILESATVNGKLYGFPFLADLFTECPIIWIRADWLKKYADAHAIPYNESDGNGLSELLPAGFNQYLDIIRWFAANNLTKGGKQSFGVAMGFGGSGLQGFADVFGAAPTAYTQDASGKYGYGMDSENAKSMMRLLNSLYREKVIDANSALDGQLLKAALSAGKVGSFVGEYWHVMEYLTNAAVNEPGCDWLPWAIKGFDGELIQPLVPLNILDRSYYAVSDRCPNPEIVVVLANHLIDAFYSDEGELTRRTVEIRQSEKYRPARDEVMMYSPVRVDAPNKNIRYAYDMQYALKTGDESRMSLDCREQYEVVKKYADDPTGTGKSYYGLYKVFGPNGAYNALNEYVDYDYTKDRNRLVVNFKRPAYTTMNTKLMNKYGGILTDFMGIQLVNFYTGDSVFTDAQWDAYIGELYAKGMREILNDLNKGK